MRGNKSVAATILSKSFYFFIFKYIFYLSREIFSFLSSTWLKVYCRNTVNELKPETVSSGRRMYGVTLITILKA